MKRAEVIAKLKAVEPQLWAHGVGALYLFGSHARDEAREGSDVDVFVDPAFEDFYNLNHFVGAHEAPERACGHRVNYGTRKGPVKFYRSAIESEAIRIF
ncbi:DNA polymerase, beta domain protein region [Methylocella tundrae]|uniref:DNA polymerase, beta domain protein region n=1 Tax=Methylocella tundrae TaxID=227605 RepID=A0A8B6MDC2_METTU|nr:nucleotidyltransferase domain-containing protein [Methylocella tundrae]VTZ26147.1 DNA polymerase, beta domain protein region [Methylocella tundrae]VTZ52356.1 DNA polymerase, beta domain protein region [Methylocella tundrae]